MRPGDLYWVEYPSGDGHEQTGRRPNLVLQDGTFAAKSPLVLAIPLTTTAGVVRYPAVILVAADGMNGLTADSYAMVFQLRATDRRRFHSKIGEVSVAVLTQVYSALDHLTGRP